MSNSDTPMTEVVDRKLRDEPCDRRAYAKMFNHACRLECMAAQLAAALENQDVPFCDCVDCEAREAALADYNKMKKELT